MPTSKPSIPKGTRDFGPNESAQRTYIIDTIKRIFVNYGFSQIETPAMEFLSTLTGKYGEEGDKLLYKIRSNKNLRKKLSDEQIKTLDEVYRYWLPQKSELALHYDLTVPFARFVVQNQHAITFPFKRFQIQPVWRADRPQKGRYREFYQCDADIIGSDSLWNEAELTLLIHDVYMALGYDRFILKINHREILMELARYAGLERKEMPFCVTIDKLDKIGRDKVKAELVDLGANPEKLETILALFNDQTENEVKIRSIEHITGLNRGIEELSKYFSFLIKINKKLKIELDFSLARGLSYYTGIIFEVKATDVSIGSITGGGRYDNLTGVFGLEGISGVGISFGLDRIYDVLEEKGLFPEALTTRTDVLIAHFDEQCFECGIELLGELRAADVRTEIFPDQAKIKKQFNYADKQNIPYVIVIGADEISKKEYTLKDMKTGSQKLLSIDQIIKTIKSD